jgi:hypothetical protein
MAAFGALGTPGMHIDEDSRPRGEGLLGVPGGVSGVSIGALLLHPLVACGNRFFCTPLIFYYKRSRG